MSCKPFTGIQSLKRPILLVFILPLLLVLSACKPQPHFISDPEYRKLVVERFAERRTLASAREEALFSVFDQDLSQEETEALQFLYAFMPLSDLADYNGAFYLDIVRTSFAIRDTFTWGSSVPEDLFRHFVLPHRVNNENLDSSRKVFFSELKDRVRHLDMKSAALEVNHWCHEKVTYEGTDERTSSPLATVRTALGRCGEESTFTVSALRSVGIPARQVYTPRWAHTDDNHAWVEFWADGVWYFMGACEPATDANKGWFTEPARRAMLMSTQTYGPWKGEGEILEHRGSSSVLNTLEVYAPVRDLRVRVLGTDGAPVHKARVEFQLYNYAEFYPIATRKTDENGFASLRTGYGDLMVWASKGDKVVWQKASGNLTDTLMLQLGNGLNQDSLLAFDLVPPLEPEPLPVSEEGKALNEIRWKQEDSIRGSYEASFISPDAARKFAQMNGLDTVLTIELLRKSRGNWAVIRDFLKETGTEGLALLGQLSLKDLRDVSAEVLTDHYVHRAGEGNKGIAPGSQEHQAFVLNPRVANEMLRPYRGYFRENAGDLAVLGPAELAQWTKDSIRVLQDENFYRAPLSPIGVFELRLSDPWSLRIFYLALCRSFGIPARLEPGTRYAQYWDGEWRTMRLEGEDEDEDEGEDEGEGEEKRPARLMLAGEEDASPEPLYSIHFSLARLKDGSFRTLDYEWEKPLSSFPEEGLELEPGVYRLTTGTRRNDGSVLAGITHFVLKPGDIRPLTVSLRKDAMITEVLATLPAGGYQLNGPNGVVDLADQRIYPAAVLWIAPGTEPTRHLLIDLQSRINELKEKGFSIYLICVSGEPSKALEILPEGIIAIDADLRLLKALEAATGRGLQNHYPVVAVTATSGHIHLLSAGYRIGSAEQMLRRWK